MIKRTLPFLVGLVFVGLLIRNSGTYPQCLADEATYSWAAGYQKLGESYYPNLLFNFIYKSVNLCGDSFYEAAKFLNLCFYFAAAIFIFKTAILFCEKKYAIIITISSILLPGNYYTSIFTPESLYYAGFWGCTYAIFKKTSFSLTKICFIGIMLGLLAQIKPHAFIIILPAALTIFLVYNPNKCEQGFVQSIKRLLAIITIMMIGVMMSFCLLRLFLSGEASLSIFGGQKSLAYSDIIRNNINLSFIAQYSFWIHLFSNVFGISVVYGLFLFQSVLLQKNALIECGTRKLKGLLIYTITGLVVLVFIESVFNSLVQGYGPYEGTSRISTRYYFFYFPCFLIMTFSLENRLRQKFSNLALFLGGIVSSLGWIFIGKYTAQTSYNDSPEIYFLNNANYFPYILFFFSLILIIINLLNEISFSKIRIILALYLFAYFGSINIFLWKILQNAKVATTHDNAGIFAEKIFLSKYNIIGDNLAGLYRAGFFQRNYPVNLYTATNSGQIESILDKTTDDSLLILNNDVAESISETIYKYNVQKLKNNIFLIKK